MFVSGSCGFCWPVLFLSGYVIVVYIGLDVIVVFHNCVRPSGCVSWLNWGM